MDNKLLRKSIDETLVEYDYIKFILARSLIFRTAQKRGIKSRTEEPLQATISLVLLELHIPEIEHAGYRSLAGRYFGYRSGQARRKKKVFEPRTLEPVSGQTGWYFMTQAHLRAPTQEFQ